MKSLESKKAKLYDKMWKTPDREKRAVMSSEIVSLESRRRKLSKKRGKLLNKQAEERRKKKKEREAISERAAAKIRARRKGGKK